MSSDVDKLLRLAVAISTGRSGKVNNLETFPENRVGFLVHSLARLNGVLKERSAEYAFFFCVCGTKHIRRVTEPIALRDIPPTPEIDTGVNKLLAALDEGYAWNGFGFGDSGSETSLLVWKKDSLTQCAEALGVSESRVPQVVARLYWKAKTTTTPCDYLYSTDEMSVYGAMAQTHYRKADAVCENCESPREDAKSKLLRCGGCHAVAYCSKECQKIHWNDSHRSACKDIRKRESSGLFVSTKSTGISSASKLVPNVFYTLGN